MTYNALQTVLQQRFSNGLEGQVAYTWSHCLTNNSGYYGTWGTATQATPASPYFQNLYNPHADYASCYYNSPNILSAYATYELPIGTGKKFGGNMNRAVNAVVGGWQASTIVSSTAVSHWPFITQPILPTPGHVDRALTAIRSQMHVLAVIPVSTTAPSRAFNI